MNVDEIIRRVEQFASDAHKILGLSEAAPSRVIQIKETYEKLGQLSVNQDDMLRQALRCVEVEVFRGAHVLAWAAMIDYLQEYAGADGFMALNSVRPKWNVTSIEDLRENHTEYQVIDAMRVAKFITRSEQKAFHGLLTRRNECAHPSGYYPDLNQTLGYVSEIVARVGIHQKRTQPKAEA